MKNVVGDNIVMRTGGVFRCCISSVLSGVNPTTSYSEGQKFNCAHCKREFVLESRDEDMVIVPADDD